jgi:cytidylate kinase
MVIAIYGESATGKTTVARILGIELNCSVRHCGNLVRALAKARGCSPYDLSPDEHLRLDNETRDLAERCEGLTVVEGRFLDVILSNTKNCVLIHLTCSPERRKVRNKSRHVKESIESRDQEDSDLRTKLYSRLPTRRPDIEINTDLETPETTVAVIKSWINNHPF